MVKLDQMTMMKDPSTLYNLCHLLLQDPARDRYHNLPIMDEDTGK